MLKQVHMMVDPLDHTSTELVEVEDLVAYLRTRWQQFPDTGRIYHEAVAIEHDVTPHSEEDCEKLKTLPGPFYVVVFPEYNVAVGFLVAIVVAAATYLLTPAPKAPLIPNVAQRNQQISSPNNELSERTNRVRINGRIPDIYGTVRSTPDLIAAPYRVFENNVEVEYAYMCIGRGHYNVTDVRDGETQVINIPGAGAVVYEPYTSPNNTTSPQSTFGNYFRQPVLNARRSNSVNGQVLRPPNTQTFTGNGNVRFRYPNVIEMPVGNAQDFTKYFVNGDSIIVSGATMTGGSSVTENVECIVTNGEFRVIVLYGRTQIALTYGAHVGLVLPADNTEIRALFTPGSEIVLTQTSSGVDLSGTYVVASAEIVEAVNVTNGQPNPLVEAYVKKFYIVEFVNPSAVNSNWDDIAPLNHANGGDDWDYLSELENRTFDAALDATETYNLNLDNTYTVVSVTQWQIVLDNPGAVDSDWAIIHSNGDVTPYLSPVITTTAASRWVGPFVITKDDTIRLFANFVAVNGLYKDNGTDQTAADVDIEFEVAAVDEDDELLGPVETFTLKMIGSTTLKETIAQTISASLSSFFGRLQVRARRTSETDEDFEGTVFDEVRWRDVYAVSSVAATDFGNVTTVQTKTYATASALAVKERQLNMLVQRKIPERVGSTNEFTDNALVGTNRADAIICAICRDRYIGNRPISEINVSNIYDTIQAVEDYFGHTDLTEFCYTFDNDNLSFEETISVIAESVFCSAFRRGSDINVSFEKKTDDPTLLFNHRNKIPGSEKRVISFGVLEENDGLEYTYIDPIDDSVISVFLPAGSPSSNPKKVESLGVRNHLQAYMHSWRIWNKMNFSNITIEFDATSEAMLLVKNDKFLSTDSTRAGSQDGEVTDVSGLTLTLSQNVDLTQYSTYSIFLQLYDGTTQSIDITAGAQANQVVLSDPPNLTLVTDSRNFARTAYMINGAEDPRQTAFLLAQRTANNGLVSTVSGINYDDRYYTGIVGGGGDFDYINDLIDRNAYGRGGGFTYDPQTPYGNPKPLEAHAESRASATGALTTGTAGNMVTAVSRTEDNTDWTWIGYSSGGQYSPPVGGAKIGGSITNQIVETNIYGNVKIIGIRFAYFLGSFVQLELEVIDEAEVGDVPISDIFLTINGFQYDGSEANSVNGDIVWGGGSSTVIQWTNFYHNDSNVFDIGVPTAIELV